MGKRCGAVICGILTLMLTFSISGCQSKVGQEGIYVMFDGKPKINSEHVFYHGQAIGKILDQGVGGGSITRVNVLIDPVHRKSVGQHWVFYVAHGRLTAGRLNSSGRPLKAGDRVCGFHSKTELSWFKVKTLLSHRIANAGRRAEKLHQRYTQSG